MEISTKFSITAIMIAIAYFQLVSTASDPKGLQCYEGQNDKELKFKKTQICPVSGNGILLCIKAELTVYGGFGGPSRKLATCLYDGNPGDDKILKLFKGKNCIMDDLNQIQNFRKPPHNIAEQTAYMMYCKCDTDWCNGEEDTSGPEIKCKSTEGAAEKDCPETGSALGCWRSKTQTLGLKTDIKRGCLYDRNSLDVKIFKMMNGTGCFKKDSQFDMVKKDSTFGIESMVGYCVCNENLCNGSNSFGSAGIITSNNFFISSSVVFALGISLLFPHSPKLKALHK